VTLTAAERGLALLRRGQTAGEARLTVTWEGLPEPALLATLARLPPVEGPAAPVSVEVIGVLLVEGRAPSG
jgi:hypothetical protein